jgi:regulator of replication initiation timing
MRQTLQELDDIKLKIKDLAEQFARIKSEKELLIQENLNLKKDLDQLRGEKDRLAADLESAGKGRDAGISDAGRKRMKKELGQYIKEIDKCLVLMQEVS